ncbi:MAG: hypothetical protein WCG02_01970 [Candidatus Taylorbacteria bacterium]
MITFDDKTIDDKFQKLPFDVQQVLISTKVTGDIRSIANNNGLLLDQASALFNIVSYTLLGLIPANGFADALIKETGLDRKIAENVVNEINEKVLADIRTSMRKDSTEQTNEETVPLQNTSSIEKAGNFTIEPQKVHDESVDVTSADKARILSEIENPPTSIFPEKIVSVPVPEEKFTEPLVDQLLTGTTSSGERKVFINIINAAPSKLPTDTSAAPTTETTPSTSLPPDAPVTPKGPDLYREEAK